MFSRLLPTMTFIFGVLIVFIVSYSLYKNQMLLVQDSTNLAATTIKNKITVQLTDQINALIRNAKRWEIQGGTIRTQWEADINQFIDHKEGYQAIEWVDADFIVRWIIPLAGNEQAVNLDLTFEGRRKVALELARDKKTVTMTKTIDLVQGGKGILVFIPLFVNEEFNGFILGVFRVKILFDKILSDIDPDYSIVITEDQNIIYHHNEEEEEEEEEEPEQSLWEENSTIKLFGVHWKVSIWPNEELLVKKVSKLPQLVFIVGIVLFALFAMVIYLYQLSKNRQKYVESVNFELDKNQKNLEFMVKKRTIELQKANLELSQFTYMVSHDLKAPLRAIRNYSEFLHEDLVDSLEGEQKNYLSGLIVAVSDADNMVKDLLELSRIGQTDFLLQYVNIGNLISGIIKPILDQNDNINIKIDDDWPSMMIQPPILKQILQNLISNAVKFHEKENIKIRIGWTQYDDKSYEFYVQDNGIGIEERYHEKIFRIFDRLHTKDEFDGTGIGLAIVQKAVEQLNGTIRLESHLKDGSTFYVIIPIAQTGGNDD